MTVIRELLAKTWRWAVWGEGDCPRRPVWIRLCICGVLNSCIFFISSWVEIVRTRSFEWTLCCYRIVQLCRLQTIATLSCWTAHVIKPITTWCFAVLSTNCLERWISTGSSRVLRLAQAADRMRYRLFSVFCRISGPSLPLTETTTLFRRSASNCRQVLVIDIIIYARH